MKNGIFKLLAVGDVVGKNGSEVLRKNLWGLRRTLEADMVIANGENAAVGNGLDKDTAELLFASGTDVITSGNHIWKKNQAYSLLENNENILRPANYPSSCPGSGYGIYRIEGLRVLVMNLLGTVFLDSLDSPFDTARRILDREKGSFDLSVIDFHAEATSEKLALARYLDGEAAVIFGTHTHVQTADEQVLPKGTGYITDLGMTGVVDSVLGVRSDIIIRRFLTKMPARHEEADGDAVICGCLFTIDTSAGRCVSVQRVRA